MVGVNSKFSKFVPMKKIIRLAYKQVLKIIIAYKKNGFQTRLVGGVSLNYDTNANSVPFEHDEFGNLYAWTVSYNPNIWHKAKFEDKKESAKALACRKLEYEIGFIVKPTDMVYVGNIPVENRIKGEKKRHVKHYLFVENFEIGSFSYFEKVLDPLNSITGPPLLVPASLLAKELYYGHVTGFKMILEYLLANRPNYLSKRYLEITLEILKKRIISKK